MPLGAPHVTENHPGGDPGAKQMSPAGEKGGK